MNVRTYLEQQQVHPQLIRAVEEFRNQYPVEEKVKYRVSDPMMPFYGTEILEMGNCRIAAERKPVTFRFQMPPEKMFWRKIWAWIFQRPTYNISFHVNTGSGDLIGTDTFEDNQVKLRKGSIYQCAEYGGFGILDEINMAKNDAVSVLHATLDYRRSIDVPGYDKIELHPAARFIGTMNYGYAGTKELNEALVSRFLVIQMPDQNEETLEKIFTTSFPEGKPEAIEQFIGLFLDLQKKAENGEISTKALDLRGILAALRAIGQGLRPSLAVRMGVINKCFDGFEKEIVEDVVMTRIPEEWTAAQVF